jgi:hypothetical protein
MNLFPKKMSSTAGDSSKDDGRKKIFFFNRMEFHLEHDWDLYLIETNSEAAPACNFKQVNVFVLFDN